MNLVSRLLKGIGREAEFMKAAECFCHKSRGGEKSTMFEGQRIQTNTAGRHLGDQLGESLAP